MDIATEMLVRPIAVNTAVARTSNRLRLDGLDGLRGVAAFYVALGHCYTLAIHPGPASGSALSRAIQIAIRLLDYPHFAVAIFIVLSGCCLMLPVARSHDGSLAGGIGGFARRRARRILPPYHAALTAVVAVHLLTTHLAHSKPNGEEFSAADIVCHFLLIHNLSPVFNMALNAPMWSVALEWQIYFVFALILLPVWRRLGTLACVALALALGYLPLIVLPATANLQWTCPWYVGLFAFGMVAAELLNSDAGRSALSDNARLIQAVLVVMAVASVAAIFLYPQWLESPNYWIADIWAGLFAALLICALGNAENRGRLLSAVNTSLSSRPMKLLGAFSYSMYLVHAPILYQFHKFIERHQASDHVQLALLCTIAVPACLCAAYVFHLVFERPFMTTR